MPKTKKIGNRVFDVSSINRTMEHVANMPPMSHNSAEHATLKLQSNNMSMSKQVQPECWDRCPETFISDLLIRFGGLADPSS